MGAWAGVWRGEGDAESGERKGGRTEDSDGDTCAYREEGVREEHEHTPDPHARRHQHLRAPVRAALAVSL